MKEAAWIIAVLLTIGVGAVAGNEAEADLQDAEALSSRDWAGQQVCGPHRTAVWEDDKTLTCLRNLGKPVRVAAGGRP